MRDESLGWENFESGLKWLRRDRFWDFEAEADSLAGGEWRTGEVRCSGGL
jgi:hypothetical protein